MNADSFFARLAKARDADVKRRADALGLTPAEWRQRQRDTFYGRELTDPEQ